VKWLRRLLGESPEPPPSVLRLHAPPSTGPAADPPAPGPVTGAFEYSTFPAAFLASMTPGQLLNSKAAEGWRFAAFDGTHYIFERPAP
jgi:hypothetical protein